MHFKEAWLIADDVANLTQFYEKVFRVKAEGDCIHSCLRLDGTGLAICSKAAGRNGVDFGFARYGRTGNFTVEFGVKGIDAAYEGIKRLAVDFAVTPEVYSWRAWPVHFRDPDGNIICLRNWAQRS